MNKYVLVQTRGGKNEYVELSSLTVGNTNKLENKRICDLLVTDHVVILQPFRVQSNLTLTSIEHPVYALDGPDASNTLTLPLSANVEDGTTIILINPTKDSFVIDGNDINIVRSGTEAATITLTECQAIKLMKMDIGPDHDALWYEVPSSSVSVPGGQTSVMPLYINLVTPVLAALPWTNMPAALSFFLSTATVAKGVTRVDLTGYTQVRLLVNKQGVAGAALSRLILRYKTEPFTQAVANYSDIGTTEVSVATNVLNTFLDSGWINLATGAKGDIFLALLGSGGDGVLDPAFGTVTAVFK